jgi:4-amino-4-deoxy-L-arabinose transferase-like glycosyltransferase
LKNSFIGSLLAKDKLMKDHIFKWTIVATAVVYCSAIGVDIMDIDAAQYAEISRQMQDSGSYLQVFEHDKDYLDKPPLLFWLSSWSMGVFGATNFAYKLPTILAALFAVFSTYRFAQVFYSKTIAQYAALMLATTQALFLTTNDCRTDTLLMACVAFTFWQLAAAFTTDSKKHFFWGFVGIGLGMLAKGPVAVVMPALAFIPHLLLKKQWKNFVRVEYLWGLGVIALILLPMCWGLYHQFDLQPDKVVNGQKSTSGLRFFFWTQSFGRITGENTWRNAVYFTYLFEGMLWSFAPWILFFIGGFVSDFIKAIGSIFKKSNPPKEYITLGGFALGYTSLATSNYQLPHYIFVIFPLAAVIAGKFLHGVETQVAHNVIERTAQKILRGLHWLAVSLLWALPFLLMVYVFPNTGFPMIIMGVLAAIYAIFSIKTRKIVQATVATALGINLFLGLYFYPKLLNYQEGSQVGRYIKAAQIPKNQFFTYKNGGSSSMHFYAERLIPHKERPEEVAIGDILYVTEGGLDLLKQEGFEFDILKTGASFAVTNLTPKFLNKTTRDEVVGHYFIVKINKRIGF